MQLWTISNILVNSSLRTSSMLWNAHSFGSLCDLSNQLIARRSACFSSRQDQLLVGALRSPRSPSWVSERNLKVGFHFLEPKVKCLLVVAPCNETLTWVSQTEASTSSKAVTSSRVCFSGYHHSFPAAAICPRWQSLSRSIKSRCLFALSIALFAHNTISLIARFSEVTSVIHLWCSLMMFTCIIRVTHFCFVFHLQVPWITVTLGLWVIGFKETGCYPKGAYVFNALYLSCYLHHSQTVWLRRNLKLICIKGIDDFGSLWTYRPPTYKMNKPHSSPLVVNP